MGSSPLIHQSENIGSLDLLTLYAVTGDNTGVLGYAKRMVFCDQKDRDGTGG